MCGRSADHFSRYPLLGLNELGRIEVHCHEKEACEEAECLEVGRVHEAFPYVPRLVQHGEVRPGRYELRSDSEIAHALQDGQLAVDGWRAWRRP